MGTILRRRSLTGAGVVVNSVVGIPVIVETAEGPKGITRRKRSVRAKSVLFLAVGVLAVASATVLDSAVFGIAELKIANV